MLEDAGVVDVAVVVVVVVQAERREGEKKRLEGGRFDKVQFGTSATLVPFAPGGLDRRCTAGAGRRWLVD